MPITFDCPSCGASLQPNGSETHVVCSYCGKTVLVPLELRAQGAQASPTFSVNVHIGGGSANHFTRQQALEIARLIQAGQKISAIKLHREISGMGLAESKSVIDQVENLVRSAGNDPSGALTEQLLESLTTVQPAVSATQRRTSRAVGVLFLIIALVVAASVIAPLVLGWFAVTRTVNSVIQLQPEDQLAPFTALTEIPGILATANFVPTQPPAASPTPGFASIVSSYGAEGIGAGMFQDARSISADGSGRVYVADYTGGRVQVFAADGSFVTQWLVDAEMPLRSLAADRDGMVYIAQAGEIHKYDGASGERLGALEAPGVSSFDDVIVTPDGGLAAVYGGAGQDDIAFFDASGKLTRTIAGAISSQTGSPELNMRLAADGLGNVYILAGFESAVFKYGPDGRFITRWGSRGSQPGQFNAAYSIAVDGQGRVYVGDSSGIQVFDSGGRYLDTIEGIRPVAFGMTFDPEGDLLVAARTQWHRLRMEN